MGLGNPGERYEGTRHNVGFLVLDELARRLEAPMRRRFWHKAEMGRARQRDVLLVKPQTYMNKSGLAVRRVCGRDGHVPGRLLVVVDDMALPPGTVRLRAQGGAGGHNGLRSVIEALGTEQFGRLRIGIGACPPDMGTVEYVLSDFPEEERLVLKDTISRAADAVMCAVEHGCEKAMNKVNQQTGGRD